ncbi:MAG TPA: sensor histidine kinase [Halomonas sp.]|nr:sensor histidine kinase [Halomonas sp.]
MTSIRARLLTWIGLPFLVLSIVVLLSSQVLLSRQINEAFDAMLLNAAQRVEQRLYSVDGKLHINMHYFSISTLGSRGEGKIFYRIRDSQGHLLAGFEGLEGPADAVSAPVFYNTRYAGNALRAVAMTYPVVRATHSDQVEVIVAESTEARESLINDFLLTLFGLIAAAGLLAISIALLAIHQGLAPLRAISRTLRRRAPNDLAPVDIQAPREVSILVTSINGLIARVRQSIQNTQQFNADVSHQLRTPISEIRALAELTAHQSRDPRIAHSLTEIERIAKEAGDMVQQLLTLAKTRHELVDSASLIPVNLVAVCRSACGDAISRIYQRGQELEFHHQSEDISAVADPVMLRWLVQNLIENASQHAGGGTAYRGTIRVTVLIHDGAPTLRVSDDGVGVSGEAIEQLTKRFYQARPGATGSGLGLAIVHEIVHAHGAGLHFHSPPGRGLTVSVFFPPPRAAGAESAQPSPA